MLQPPYTRPYQKRIGVKDIPRSQGPTPPQTSNLLSASFSLSLSNREKQNPTHCRTTMLLPYFKTRFHHNLNTDIDTYKAPIELESFTTSTREQYLLPPFPVVNVCVLGYNASLASGFFSSSLAQNTRSYTRQSLRESGVDYALGYRAGTMNGDVAQARGYGTGCLICFGEVFGCL